MLILLDIRSILEHLPVARSSPPKELSRDMPFHLENRKTSFRRLWSATNNAGAQYQTRKAGGSLPSWICDAHHAQHRP